MMNRDSEDEHDRLLRAWRSNGDARDLYVQLRDPMRRAARRGIRQLLGDAPDPEDVDEALFKAFTELLEKVDAVQKSLEGFACSIAYRRGQDRARAIIRQREQLKNHAWEIHNVQVEAGDELRAAAQERLLAHALECMEVLTAEQREVIEATLQRQASLSDWTASRGTTYEAGRRMRERGLESLRRCVDEKLGNDSEGKSR